MPQVLAGPAMPGGELVAGFGGFLKILPAGSSTPSQALTLNVGLWQVQAIFRNVEVTHSGCMGAITRRRVAYDYLYRCQIPWDAAYPPDLQLNSAAGIGIEFHIGDPGSYKTGQAHVYASPSALADDQVTICNSTGTDIVRAELTGRGNSLMFLVTGDWTAYNNYVATLQARGWL